MKGRFLGNDAKGNYFSHEEGHTGSFFKMEKHVGFIVEVLQIMYGEYKYNDKRLCKSW